VPVVRVAVVVVAVVVALIVVFPLVVVRVTLVVLVVAAEVAAVVVLSGAVKVLEGPLRWGIATPAWCLVPGEEFPGHAMNIPMARAAAAVTAATTMLRAFPGRIVCRVTNSLLSTRHGAAASAYWSCVEASLGSP
jgi:hypothetical protein